MAAETVASRYNRDWLSLKDDRKIRGFDDMAAERRNREYVDPATNTTVTATGDNSNGFTVPLAPK
jgi:hypothetical protein